MLKNQPFMLRYTERTRAVYLNIIFIFILMSFILSACGGSTSTPVVAEATVTAAAPTRPAATLAPTLAPTPVPAQGKVVLVAPEGEKTVRAALQSLVAEAKLAFEARSALKKEDLRPEWKIVVLLQAPDDLPGLLSAAPATQFLLLGDAQPAANLSVIRQDELQRAFVAGYITALVAPDWRAGGLLPADPATLVDAFVNGGRYWCGRCIPHYAPLVLFPIAVTQPAGAALTGWQDALNQMNKSILQAVYASPQASTPELLKAMVNQNLIVVGTSTPTSEVQGRYATSVVFDPLPALKKLWPDLLAGKGGAQAPATLTWADVNEAYFTPGKQRLALEVTAGLADGTIGPLSVP
jgi:hypothetical protein